MMMSQAFCCPIAWMKKALRYATRNLSLFLATQSQTSWFKQEKREILLCIRKQQGQRDSAYYPLFM